MEMNIMRVAFCVMPLLEQYEEAARKKHRAQITQIMPMNLTAPFPFSPFQTIVMNSFE
jgi:hypothetical protein